MFRNLLANRGEATSRVMDEQVAHICRLVHQNAQADLINPSPNLTEFGMRENAGLLQGLMVS